MNLVCPTTGNYSQAHKYQCLLRWICHLSLGKPGNGWRITKFLKDYRERHGKEQGDLLENDVREMFDRLKTIKNQEAA